ncbi:hypothetical protein D1872_306990 [compost metagenome]
MISGKFMFPVEFGLINPIRRYLDELPSQPALRFHERFRFHEDPGIKFPLSIQRNHLVIGEVPFPKILGSLLRMGMLRNHAELEP